MRDHSIENRYAPKPSSASSAMSAGYRQKWSHASPDGSLHRVFAALKRRSPSKGDLAPDLDPAMTAKAYESGGAAALSVLTDRLFFGGTIDDLRAARDATGLPALRKDFTIADIQIYEARAVGA